MTKLSIYQKDFETIFDNIVQAKQTIYTQARNIVIDLYWSVGRHISERVENGVWGTGIVDDLAKYISQKDPAIKGFSNKNLWRMKQFFEAYKDDVILSPLVRELPWTHNTIIFSRCKTKEEKTFYLNLAIKERYSKRELERQIDSSLFERTSITNTKIPDVLKKYSNIQNTFKDHYVLEFVGIPIEHSENDLQTAIVDNMKNFILEIGKDFIFIDKEFKVQVGNSDFFIDLLFYNRRLSALVAFEIKIGKFKPEYLGQLNFYLEALDRDIKKEHENPSIGVLLCSYKDDEVVEYAMSRTLSPTLVAQYTTLLPQKKLLQTKLHEIVTMLER